jgi:hypothetical protein
MKKLAVLVVLICFALTTVFAIDAAVSWNWYKNDRNVKYFRYQLDGEEEDGWTVVKSSVQEVYLDVDVSVPHVLYLQQSYDGVHWSESSFVESETYSEEDFYYDDEDYYYDDYEEELLEEEEVTPQEEVVEEVVAEETPIVEETGPTGKSFLNFAFSYRNSIPYHDTSKNIGVVASFTHLFPFDSEISESFTSGFRTELGFYLSEEIFTEPSNTDYFVVASILGTMNFSPAKGDFSIAFGPEVQLKFGSTDPVFCYGLNSLLGMRFTLSEKYSLGLAVADHFYFYPEKHNLFDFRVSFSLNI